jgi:arabinose-5-phosphate isomerase
MKHEAQKNIEFTLEKEVEAVHNVRRALNADFFKSIDLIKKRKGAIIVTGIGKSGFVGMKMVSTLVSLGHQAAFIHPVDALHGDSGIVRSGDVLIAISISGESLEVTKITRYLKRHFKITVIAITAKKDSTLRTLSDAAITLTIDHEGSAGSLAPMASAVATMVIGDLIASALTRGNFKAKHFAKFHPGGSLGLKTKTVRELMKKGSRIPLVKDSTSFKKTLEVMNRKRFGVVGVVNHKRLLAGVITDGDVRRFLMKQTAISEISAAI